MNILQKIKPLLFQSILKLLVAFSFILVFFGISVMFFSVSVSQAALLTIESSQNAYNQGDTFLATVQLNTEREEINAAEINIVFPPEQLEAVDFGKGNSVFTL